MCGVLLWWNVTPPSEIGHTTRRVSSGSQQSRSLCTFSGWLVLEHAVEMAAVDEVHAPVALVDVVHRHPAGDAAVVEVAAPVALVLMPQVGALVCRRLGEELVVPELERPTHQRDRELDRPLAEEARR